MKHLNSRNQPKEHQKGNKPTDWNFRFKFSKLYYLVGDQTLDTFGLPVSTFAYGKKYYFQPDLTLERRTITAIETYSNQSFGGNGFTPYNFGTQIVPLGNAELRGFFLNLMDRKNNYILKDVPLVTFLYDPNQLAYNRVKKTNLNNISLERSYVTTNSIVIGFYPPMAAVILNLYTQYLSDGSLYDN
jgi:hypothetical protein